MKLELDVLASTCIRRKKPWPRLAFIGHVSTWLNCSFEQGNNLLCNGMYWPIFFITCIECSLNVIPAMVKLF